MTLRRPPIAPGQKYGMLTVIAQQGKLPTGLKLWRCRCDCGNEKVIRGDHVRRNEACGCLRGRLPWTDEQFGASALRRLWEYISPEPNSGCWLWTGPCDSNGYGVLIIRSRHLKATRFMAELVGMDPGALFVCHKCDTPLCVNPAHFFIGTQTDNLRDMVRKGRSKNLGQTWSRGEGNPMAKLTPRDVVAIRRLYSQGGASQRQLAVQFGVSKSLIRQIAAGIIWRHIE